MELPKGIIWANDDKSIMIGELIEDYVLLNIVHDEVVVSVIMDRLQIESLVDSLAEWVGLPLYLPMNDFDFFLGEEDRND
tara:strand:+ start:17462 stop:17701 length:240 start_codon:yes stop_codon:yes gene_type:complete